MVFSSRRYGFAPSPRSSSTVTHSSARARGGSGSVCSSASTIRGSKSVSSGSSTGSIDSGSAIGRPVLVVHDRERLAPVALPAEQPVAQLVRDRRRAGAGASEPFPDDALRPRRSRGRRATPRRSPSSCRRRRRCTPRAIRRPSASAATPCAASHASGGRTTPTIGSSNSWANSKSRSSCAGTAMIAPVP